MSKKLTKGATMVFGNEILIRHVSKNVWSWRCRNNIGPCIGWSGVGSSFADAAREANNHLHSADHKETEDQS